jgi:hypothetical protein
VIDDTTPLGHRDWLKDLKIDENIHCDSPGCKRPASVWARVRCCEAVMILCRTCMIDLVTVLNLRIRTKHPIHCVDCDNDVDPQGWISRPEPI